MDWGTVNETLHELNGQEIHHRMITEKKRPNKSLLREILTWEKNSRIFLFPYSSNPRMIWSRYNKLFTPIVIRPMKAWMPCPSFHVYFGMDSTPQERNHNLCTVWKTDNGQEQSLHWVNLINAKWGQHLPRELCLSVQCLVLVSDHSSQETSWQAQEQSSSPSIRNSFQSREWGRKARVGSTYEGLVQSWTRATV